MRQLHDFLYRQDGAERIGDMCHGDQSGARRQQPAKRVELELPVGPDRHGAQLCTGRRAQHLPGHDVGVVLQVGDQDLIAGPDMAASPAVARPG